MLIYWLGMAAGVAPQPVAWGEDREALIAEARQAERRVLVLGDSFLAWWPIEHSLHDELGRWAREQGMALALAAYGGFGPLEYRDQAEGLVPALEPELTILFYYAGNDLTNVQHRAEPQHPEDFKLKLWSPRGVRVAEAQRARERMRFSLTPSAHAQTPPPAGAFDWEAMRAHGIDEQLIEFAQNREREPNRVGPEYVNPYLLVTAMTEPRYLVDNLLIETAENLAAWRRVEQEIAAIGEICGDAGSELWVVAIPSTLQVSDSHFDFYRRAKFVMDDRVLTSDRPQRLIEELCAREEINFLDLLPAFKKNAAAGAELYWENDDHLNDNGHALAMKLVRERILERSGK